MDDLLGMLGALLAFVVPMALVGWLLGRPERPRRGRSKGRSERRGKMTHRE